MAEKNSRKIVKNCFLQVQGVHLKKRIFFQKKLLVWLPNFERKLFWLSAKLQQIGCQNFSLRVLETKWRNRFFTNFLVFTYIRTSSETFCDFWKFLFANLSKLLFRSSDELFDQKNFWEKLLSLFCRVVIKMFCKFSQKMYIRVVKTNFCVFRNYFEEPEFSEKLISCLVHTRVLSIILPDFWDKSLLKVFKTASYTFKRTLWWKTILLLQFFEIWSKQFFMTDDYFFVAKLSRLLSTISGEHFDKKTFLKNPSSFFSGQRAILFSDFRQKIYRQVVETVLYVFRKLLEDAGFFKLFCFRCKFRFWANFFLIFGTNFSVKLSKLLSLCFDEHFDGKCIFKVLLHFVFGLWAKQFLTSCRNFRES